MFLNFMCLILSNKFEFELGTQYLLFSTVSIANGKGFEQVVSFAPFESKLCEVGGADVFLLDDE